MIYRPHFFRNLLAKPAAITRQGIAFIAQRQSARPTRTNAKNLRFVKIVFCIFSIRICILSIMCYTLSSKTGGKYGKEKRFTIKHNVKRTKNVNDTAIFGSNVNPADRKTDEIDESKKSVGIVSLNKGEIMIKIAVLTAGGILHIEQIKLVSPEKIEEFVSDNYGNNIQWQQITKTINHSDDKPYIFLTSGGNTTDDGGNDVNNCQYLAIAKGSDVLTAFNNMLSDESHSGQYDSCFAYELSDDKIKGSFDLSDNIPAECEDSECEDCTLSDDEKTDLDCPYVNN